MTDSPDQSVPDPVVLVVEWESEYALQLAEKLRLLGIPTNVYAGTGIYVAEAIRRCQQTTPQIVISNLNWGSHKDFGLAFLGNIPHKCHRILISRSTGNRRVAMENHFHFVKKRNVDQLIRLIQELLAAQE